MQGSVGKPPWGRVALLVQGEEALGGAIVGFAYNVGEVGGATRKSCPRCRYGHGQGAGRRHVPNSALYVDMNAFEKHKLNDRDGLDWVHRFGWLRTFELGALLWPDTNEQSRTRQANRLARSWIERGLVLERVLPEGSGRALVLATGGVRLLSEYGVEANTGKDIGKLIDGQWLPPLTWRHDLLATGVLIDLYLRGYEVLPEAHIRRHAGNLVKIPDGLAIKNKTVVWLEVESARKTGKAMRELADALCVVGNGKAAPICGHKPTNALVAYPADLKDERGHALSHRTRVRTAVAEAAKSDVGIDWAACAIRGAAGVGAIKYEREIVQANRAAAILKRLDWNPNDDGVLVASYGKNTAFVWEDADGLGWGYCINDNAGDRADTQAAAKRKCAAALASL